MPIKLQRRRSFLPTLSINTIAITDPDNRTMLQSKIHIIEKTKKQKKQEKRATLPKRFETPTNMLPRSDGTPALLKTVEEK